MLSACTDELQFTQSTKSSFTPSDQPDPDNSSTRDFPRDDDPPTICDPNETLPPSAEHGVKGNLSLLPPEADLSFVNLGSFWRVNPLHSDELLPTVEVPANIYFSDLNVPERAFTQGFAYQQGGALLDPRDSSGQTILIEWFSLKFEGHLKLSSSDAPGKYYLSLIADDGAKLEIWQNGAWRTMIDNDGTHPQRLGCSNTGDYLDLNTSSDIRYRVTYFQGPRYHISLMLLWKHLDAGEEALSPDPLCGVSGNDYFHDSRVVPSVPTSRWDELVSRGWQVIRPENFYLPTGSANPCAE